MKKKRGIIGVSSYIKDLLEKIKREAKEDRAVLILGPTGSGKELVANNIHYEGKRREEPYVRLNCAAIPGTLLESELFGHEKGSFTGAIKRRIGQFELAAEGTIFLDEIGDMSMDLQAKLLRVLEEKEFYSVGGTTPIIMKARVISSTNKDLKKEIKEGRFREDLFYRLKQTRIGVEALNDHPEDVICLVNHFLFEPRRMKCDPRAKILFYAYDWPGNVRELKSMVSHAGEIDDVIKELEKEWSPEREKLRHQHEAVNLRSMERPIFSEWEGHSNDRDMFRETLEFIQTSGIDFKKYAEIYEILRLKNVGIKNEKIARILHIIHSVLNNCA